MAPPLTALIIDDEPLARQELQYLLDAAGDVNVLAQVSNGIDAVDQIRTLKPDVVFLDVRMPGLDGFAVLRKVLALDKRARLPEVVFATAFDQYAVRAFEVNAVDYLLKPFDASRVVKTLDKVRARLSATAIDRAADRPHEPVPELAPTLRVTESAEDDGDFEETVTDVAAGSTRGTIAGIVAGAEAKLDALLRMIERNGQPLRSGKVVVRTQNRLLLVDQKDVCFASIEEGRISVVTNTVEGDSNCRTLEELMDQLDPEQFWRAHRSYVVNIQHIREVVPWFKSTYQLRMDDRKQTEVPVSRSQTKRLRELFNL
ncbi:two component transcriptional regulator, LytTR family [Bryocella elongata]|uniref:Two component transcriptional regulator, LytTR family n=1 Tax=Bryocella elongata TaxID=863522 RepID=A0A1H6BQV6_9BACT|nr:LytTR family transcriptional regulator DNA-binding domain-containing protein [Bryocella elongata]SEG63079.1 two component transcriptional regulator, LytTR family [Bryocella elongata]